MPRLLIILAAVALLVAGCGGGGSKSGTASAPPLTKKAYQDKLKSISGEIGKSVGKTSSSGKLSQEDIDKLTKAFHTFADRLRGLNPPPAVRQLHARLIKALDDLGDEFPDIAKKLNNSGKDASAAIGALLQTRSIQALIKLGEDFKAKGYNLDLNGQ